MRLNLGCSTGNNLLTTGIYPAVSARCCTVCHIICTVPISFRRVDHGRMIKTLVPNRGRRSCLETLGPAFESGIQYMKQFAHNWYLSSCRCTETWPHVSSIRIYYLYTYARCKQPSGESFLSRIGSMLCQVCDTIRPVPIRFWCAGHAREVRTLGTIVGGGVATCATLGSS